MMKYLLVLFLVFVSTAHADQFDRVWKNKEWKKSVGSLAIQSGGRIKPLDTFAREGMELLTGKQKFRGHSSLEMLLSMLFEPNLWQEVEFIQINHRPLVKDLGLPEKADSFYSNKEIMHSVRLMPLFQELQAKQKAQEKLDPYFQAVNRLGNQIAFMQDLISGRALRLVPPNAEQYNKSDAWLGFEEYSDTLKLRFALMAASFTSPEEATREKLSEYADKFRELAASNNPKLYPDMPHMKWEIHFNDLHPFRWAWIFALTATILFTFSFYSAKKFWAHGGAIFFVASFVMQIYGFALRCWIAGRPPVSNMYESIIWVAFGCMLFGLILELVYRKRVIMIASLLFSTIALIVADQVTGVLDAGIQPLEPVLRSNFWLLIHVLTITLGYAAFSLSLILGNMGLGQIVFLGKESTTTPLRLLSFYAYRAVQVGVILLAAGTILGGVWAEYSWGRFWGWDPKETWALIALLGYLALIHARFKGMVSHIGFLAGCVGAFLGVLMAWYGVNFVLGAGLHTYGFSSGGMSVVATYSSIQLLFVAYAVFLYKKDRAMKTA